MKQLPKPLKLKKNRLNTKIPKPLKLKKNRLTTKIENQNLMKQLHYIPLFQLNGFPTR
jgi:hypothetical protein